MIYDIEHMDIIGDTFNEDHDKVFGKVSDDILAGNVQKSPMWITLSVTST